MSVLYQQITSLGTARPLGYGLSSASAVTIAAKGTGYHKNDLLTLAGGTALIAATFRVTEVDDDGRIVSLSVENVGCYSSKPTNAAGTTGGDGSHATVTVTYNDNVVPHGVRSATIQAESQSVRWRDDGTDPTSSVGNVLTAGSSVTPAGSPASVRVIEVTSSAKLNVTYYR